MVWKLLFAPDAGGAGSAGGAGAGGGAGSGAGGGRGAIDAANLGDGGDDGDGEQGGEGAAGGRGKPSNAIRDSIRDLRGARAAERAKAGAGAGKSGDDTGAGEGEGDGGEGRAGDGEGGDGAGGEAQETDEQFETRIAALEPEEQTAEREAREAILNGESDPRLTLEFEPMREGEEPYRVVAEDQAMADHIRHLQRRARAGDTAHAIREQAEAIRAQADELQFEVDVDPVSFMARREWSPSDHVALARFLLTQPGVLGAKVGNATLGEWVAALAENPDALGAEAERAEAVMIKRREKVEPQVKQRRFENQNARQCVRRAYETVDKLVPKGWTDEQRNRIVDYVIKDLQDVQRNEQVTVTDPKRVPLIVEGVLKAFGVAPGSPPARTGAGNGRPTGKGPGRTGPTGKDFVKGGESRRRAAGPGAGAGSPTAQIPPLPKGKEGESSADRWKRGFAHVRSAIRTLRRAP